MTARFYEVDRAGILFFGRVFEMCHAAYEEMLLAGGCGIDQLIDIERAAMPLVHAEADFAKPIRLHDRIDVELAIERLGGRSVTFGYTLRGDNGEVRATAKLVHAFVGLEDFEATTAPARLVDGWRRLGLID